MKQVIFDLDLTLIDSTIAEIARSQRNWQLVYSLIPKFSLYEGMDEVFEYIRKHSITVAIVSTSPRPYIEKVIKHFNIPCDYIVGYHDAKPIKPHPAPMLRALELISSNIENTISFGDRAIDIQSSNNANIKSVACFWGTKERDLLIKSNYTFGIHEPIQICDLVDSI